MSAVTTIMGLVASAARNVRPQVNVQKLMEFVQLIHLLVLLAHLHLLDAVEDVIAVNQCWYQIHQNRGVAVMLLEPIARKLLIVLMASMPVLEHVSKQHYCWTPE